MKTLKITLTMRVDDSCGQNAADAAAGDALNALLESLGYELFSPDEAEAEAFAVLSDGPRVLNEYRCTRSMLYRHDCLGRDDLAARQGHYVWAESPESARLKMSRDFPQDMLKSKSGQDMTHGSEHPSLADAFTAYPTGQKRQR